PLAGDAERGLAQPPQRIADEPDAEQPERDRTVGLAREQLQGACLIGFPGTVAERDQDCDPANQYVDDTPCREPGPGQQPRWLAVRRPPGLALRVRHGYRSHTRAHYPQGRAETSIL